MDAGHLVFNVDSPLPRFGRIWGVLKEIKKVLRQGEFEWQITMHHGSAFAQSIADWVTNTMSSINSFVSGPRSEAATATVREHRADHRSKFADRSAR